MTSTPVHVAFGADAAYVPHLAAAIASVRATTRRPLRFIVMQTGIAAADQRRIEACAPGAAFDWIGIEDARLLSLEGNQHFASPATFFRLALPRLAPAGADRIIYLDSDLAAAADVGRLYDAALGGRPVGAVYDAGIDAVSFATRWELAAAPGRYFNAGVMLIDLSHAHTPRLFAEAADFAVRHRSRLPFCDQDALNHVLWGRWQPLDPIWNVQRNMIIAGMSVAVPQPHDPRRRPAIVHYTTAEKPWLRGTYHPYGWLYWRALARTPYFGQVVAANRIGRVELLRWLARHLKHWSRLVDGAPDGAEQQPHVAGRWRPAR